MMSTNTKQELDEKIVNLMELSYDVNEEEKIKFTELIKNKSDEEKKKLALSFYEIYKKNLDKIEQTKSKLTFVGNDILELQESFDCDINLENDLKNI